MLKLLIAGQKAPGKTREAALHHLQTIHGPLVYDAPEDAGAMPSRYVQNHVFDGSRIAALDPYVADRDLITEIWFDDVPHLLASTQTPYYKTVLQPDEGNFVDQASVLKGIVIESDAWGEPPADAVKLFVFLTRRATVSSADFDAASYALSEPNQTRTKGPSAFVRNTPLPRPDGTPPYADSVAEFWFEDRAGAETFCTEVLAPILEGELSGTLDPLKSFYVLADAYPVERLRATALAS